MRINTSFTPGLFTLSFLEKYLQLNNPFLCILYLIIILLTIFQVLDECYRLLRVVMSQKQPLLNVDDVLRELRGMNTAASDHFTKRIIPANKGAQGLQMISTGISSSYSCLTVNEAPVFKTEDRLLIDRQRNEISNLRSKVNLPFYITG